MKLKITFYPGGQWEGGGMLPARLQDFSRLAEWIGRFLKEINEVKTYYASALLNDGVLLGQEKANLIKETDDVVAGLLLFRRYLSLEPSERIIAGDGMSFRFNIQILDNLWTGNGELSTDDELDRESLSALHNDVIPKKVKRIFARYGAAIADGRLSGEERDSLHSGIDDLLNYLLRIERQLLCD